MKLRAVLLNALDYRLAILALWAGVGVLWSGAFFRVDDGSDVAHYQNSFVLFAFCFLSLYAWGSVWKWFWLTHKKPAIHYAFLLIFGGIILQAIEIEGANDGYLGLASNILGLVGLATLLVQTKHMNGIKKWFFGLWIAYTFSLLVSAIESFVYFIPEEWYSPWYFDLVIVLMQGAYACMTIFLFRAYKNPPTTSRPFESLINEIGQPEQP